MKSIHESRDTKNRFPHQMFIKAFGVRIRVSSNQAETLPAIKEILTANLAGLYRLTAAGPTDHSFRYRWSKNGQDSIYKNGSIVGMRQARDNALDQLGSQIRLTIGEFAVGKVFVHAGVVGWKGKAIVIPARSFSGKSALTAELVRRGALYYSDEYAVFDTKGLVSPYPKMLSIRGEIDDHQQVEYPVEAFGGRAGTRSIPVGMVLITRYKPRARFDPKVMPRTSGLLEMIDNTLSIRRDPSFALEVLGRVAKNSMIVKTPRGEASRFADRILRYFEAHCL